MNDFDPPTAIKGLKTSLYGQWKGLKALEYSRLDVLRNPEKSRDCIFENPGIRILKKSRDPGTSLGSAGVWSPLGFFICVVKRLKLLNAIVDQNLPVWAIYVALFISQF